VGIFYLWWRALDKPEDSLLVKAGMPWRRRPLLQREVNGLRLIALTGILACILGVIVGLAQLIFGK
jgi:hypothetical protein